VITKRVIAINLSQIAKEYLHLYRWRMNFANLVDELK
jgi:hypothetical protein